MASRGRRRGAPTGILWCTVCRPTRTCRWCQDRPRLQPSTAAASTRITPAAALPRTRGTKRRAPAGASRRRAFPPKSVSRPERLRKGTLREASARARPSLAGLQLLDRGRLARLWTLPLKEERARRPRSGGADVMRPLVRPLVHLAVGEIELVDAAGAHADFLGRYQYLMHVLARLPVMLLQLEHALLQPGHISHQAADFGTNEVGGFAHAGILQNLLHHLDRQHQKGGRYHDDPGPIGLLDQIVKPVIKFRVDGFRWHEHQRHLLGFAGQEIFTGDVGNVLPDVLAQALSGAKAVFIGLALTKSRDGFKRKLGVDDERTLVWQKNHAVRPGIIGQGVLEC